MLYPSENTEHRTTIIRPIVNEALAANGRVSQPETRHEPANTQMAKHAKLKHCKLPNKPKTPDLGILPFKAIGPSIGMSENSDSGDFKAPMAA